VSGTENNPNEICTDIAVAGTGPKWNCSSLTFVGLHLGKITIKKIVVGSTNDPGKFNLNIDGDVVFAWCGQWWSDSSPDREHGHTYCEWDCRTHRVDMWSLFKNWFRNIHRHRCETKEFLVLHNYKHGT
jgi:hypothetical protein